MLPKPGRWMETLQTAHGLSALRDGGGYLVWVLAGPDDARTGCWRCSSALTLIAMAVWLYGRFSGHRVRSVGRCARLPLVAAPSRSLHCALYIGWPQVAQTPAAIQWEPWSPERIAAAAERQARSIYVDFTARWCATCQANKKLVFSSQKVRDVFRDRNIALLKGDWTNSDPLHHRRARASGAAAPCRSICSICRGAQSRWSCRSC